MTFLPKDSSDTVTRFTIRTSQASVKDETARLTKEETATLKDQDDKATVGADALPATRLTFQEERDKDVGGLRVAQYYLLEGNSKTWIVQLQTFAEAQETLLPRMEAMLGTFQLVR